MPRRDANYDDVDQDDDDNWDSGSGSGSDRESGSGSGSDSDHNDDDDDHSQEESRRSGFHDEPGPPLSDRSDDDEDVEAYYHDKEPDEEDDADARTRRTLIICFCCCCIILLAALGTFLGVVVFGNNGDKESNEDGGAPAAGGIRPPFGSPGSGSDFNGGDPNAAVPPSPPSPRAPTFPPITLSPLSPTAPPTAAPTGIPTLTPAPTITFQPSQPLPVNVTILAEADTSIRNKSQRNIPNGNSDTLLVQVGAARSSYDSYALMTFDGDALKLPDNPRNKFFDEQPKAATLHLTHIPKRGDAAPFNVTVVALEPTLVDVETLFDSIFDPVGGWEGPTIQIKPDDVEVNVDITSLVFGGAPEMIWNPIPDVEDVVNNATDADSNVTDANSTDANNNGTGALFLDKYDGMGGESGIGHDSGHTRHLTLDRINPWQIVLILINRDPVDQNQPTALGASFRSREFERGSKAPRVVVEFANGSRPGISPTPPPDTDWPTAAPSAMKEIVDDDTTNSTDTNSTGGD